MTGESYEKKLCIFFKMLSRLGFIGAISCFFSLFHYLMKDKREVSSSRESFQVQ